MSLDDLGKLTAALRGAGVGAVDLAVVLGSGLGSVAERIDNARIVDYEHLDGLPHARVSGHAGRLVLGEIGGKHVVLCQGRVHRYEGWRVSEVTRLVRALAALGTPHFLLTNAAGSMRIDAPPGTLMRVVDHIDLQPGRRVPGARQRAGNPYDAELGELLQRAADARGVDLRTGVYAGVLGPSYETPAEIEMLRWMGAHAVGMSTVAEAAALYDGGARVTGLSLLSNYAAGMTQTPLDHSEVLEAGARQAVAVGDLLEQFVLDLPARG